MKRSRILPIDTPDQPRQSPPIEDSGVDPELRATVWPCIVAGAIILWGSALAGAAWAYFGW